MKLVRLEEEFFKDPSMKDAPEDVKTVLEEEAERLRRHLSRWRKKRTPERLPLAPGSGGNVCTVTRPPYDGSTANYHHRTLGSYHQGTPDYYHVSNLPSQSHLASDGSHHQDTLNYHGSNVSVRAQATENPDQLPSWRCQVCQHNPSLCCYYPVPPTGVKSFSAPLKDKEPGILPPMATTSFSAPLNDKEPGILSPTDGGNVSAPLNDKKPGPLPPTATTSFSAPLNEKEPGPQPPTAATSFSAPLNDKEPGTLPPTDNNTFLDLLNDMEQGTLPPTDDDSFLAPLKDMECHNAAPANFV